MIQPQPRPLAKCVVLVDDEKAYLEMLSQQVAVNLGCPVHTFNRPEEAIEAIPGLNVGLIITDFLMPGLTGFQLIRRVQRIAPEIPIVLITAVPTDFPDYDPAEMPSLKAIVHKPFKWTELAGHIARHSPTISNPPLPSDDSA